MGGIPARASRRGTSPIEPEVAAADVEHEHQRHAHGSSGQSPSSGSWHHASGVSGSGTAR